MHSSGTIARKADYIERLEPLIQKFKPENRRCLYENEDVLVMHFIMPFPNGTKDAVLYYIQKEDGLMRRIETGSTSLKWDIKGVKSANEVVETSIIISAATQPHPSQCQSYPCKRSDTCCYPLRHSYGVWLSGAPHGLWFWSIKKSHN